MFQSVQKSAVGKAHGKLILIGEHSVVYGMPAIALPFPLIEVQSVVKEVQDAISLTCDYYDGPLSMVPEKMLGISACINKTLKILNKPAEGLLIQLSSTIPLGRGLGSSAAVAVAIVKSIFAYFGHVPEQNQLMSLVHIAETHAHGNPSGVDMYAAASEVPIWFQKDKEVSTIQIGAPLHLVVADSGRIGDTHAAVSSVKKNYKSNPINTKKSLNRLKEIAFEAKTALSNGKIEFLGTLMNLAQDQLIALGVSDEGINLLVDAALSAGALGSKLTGGGRGGCVMAIARNREHAEKLASQFVQAGASNTWNFTLEKSN